ncbi:sterol desaturase family protein [Bythopirellula polymerisocia]|uniref:Fatty acid hydroxylase superfamily protein n=1 Tax=Bythopirellula polymerisocia TaxID=2528003 RepID=A0A5C6CIT6_9BACT|nr:sterol desaturase family protein [Bythopirellula polymerisocia]TWU22669.1 Fatty acid hydroxylase superfamily protein [Bythopirellula polymerisocia]
MATQIESVESIRLIIFIAVFAVMALWEFLAPRRPLSSSKAPRWGSNLGLVVLNNVMLRLIVPLGMVGVAYVAQASGWGLFNAVEAPYWLEVLFSVILLDLVIYLQHVTFHLVPLLWRFHLVHHADLDIDVTTGLRFHTIEILISLGIKAAAIVLLGVPPVAVVTFEVLLNSTAMFNHSNIQLPLGIDAVLRWLVVTPDMHRVHHSWHKRETNSNYGFNLPWWDRLFRTYRDQPQDGHLGMTIGLKQIRDEQRAERLHWMLALPFVSKSTNATERKED